MMTAATLEVHPATGRATSKQIPHGTVSGHKHWKCRCLPCMNAAAEYQRRRSRRQGYGTWQPFTNIAPVRAHIEALHDQGMAYEHIARAADMKLPNLARIRRDVSGRPAVKQIRHETAARILAVRLDLDKLPPTAWVPARGTLRRIQALRAIGWSLTTLSERCRIDRHTLSSLPSNKSVQVDTWHKIRDLYEDFHDQDPVRHGVARWVRDRTRREARAADYAPPTAWDDIDTDGMPAPKLEWRVHYTRAAGPERRQALVEDTAELAALGVPRDLIAERLGVKWSAITQAHSRCGVPLPEIAA